MTERPPTAVRVPRRHYTVADRVSVAALEQRLRSALGGDATQVIWEDRGSDVLVHLDTLRVHLADQVIVVGLELESVETGRGALVVQLVFGSAQGKAGLVACTDEQVRGHPQLAARWGAVFRDVVWAELLRITRDHAVERGLAPQHVHVLDGHLRLGAAPAPQLDHLLPSAQRFPQPPFGHP